MAFLHCETTVLTFRPKSWPPRRGLKCIIKWCALRVIENLPDKARFHWWHSFLDRATLPVSGIWNSRTLSDVMGHLQSANGYLAMLLNCTKSVWRLYANDSVGCRNKDEHLNFGELHSPFSRTKAKIFLSDKVVATSVSRDFTQIYYDVPSSQTTSWGFHHTLVCPHYISEEIENTLKLLQWVKIDSTVMRHSISFSALQKKSLPLLKLGMSSYEHFSSSNKYFPLYKVIAFHVEDSKKGTAD